FQRARGRMFDYKIKVVGPGESIPRRQFDQRFARDRGVFLGEATEAEDSSRICTSAQMIRSRRWGSGFRVARARVKSFLGRVPRPACGRGNLRPSPFDCVRYVRFQVKIRERSPKSALSPIRTSSTEETAMDGQVTPSLLFPQVDLAPLAAALLAV